MKKFLHIPFVFALLFIAACSSDDTPPDTHEIGQWTLDLFEFDNVPAEFSNQAGEVPISSVSFGGAVIDRYDLELINDGTFDAFIDLQGSSNVRDDGSWEIDDDFLILEGEDIAIEWQIFKNEEDQLWLAEEAQFLLLKDAFTDTAADDYLSEGGAFSQLDSEDQDSILNLILGAAFIDLVYKFERDQ